MKSTIHKWRSCVLLFACANLLPNPVQCALTPGNSVSTFTVTLATNFYSRPMDGRVLVVFGNSESVEPRLSLGETGPDAPVCFAKDVKGLEPGKSIVLDSTSFSFGLDKIDSLMAAGCFIQAVFDCDKDLRSANAPGNSYSRILKLSPGASLPKTTSLELTEQIPPEQLPPETELVKFIKIQSKLLSEFHGRPIFLRAGVILPGDFNRETSTHYPLWLRIGGLNTRYDIVSRQMSENSGFRNTWLAPETPKFILVQLDGAGPLGDPYYINSACSGPYGDALVKELIPAIEEKFRALGTPSSRVLSGTSTGGWVCLALQVFYPDFFNGAWSSSPDPVDFRAFELVNIYQDENAFVNQYGNERPSERDLKGDISVTMRHEVSAENLLGRGNSYTLSGQQWGEWMAAFSERAANGSPVPLWDPQSGKIDHVLADNWKKYDLRLVLEKNWKTLGPSLRGKIHIAAGEADQYFLNNAVHLLDDFLSKADPPTDAKIFYAAGKPHGWSNLTLRGMLDEMKSATEQKQPIK